MDPLNLENLESLPKTKEEHLWADFLELLCLTHTDGEISKAAVVDRINERRPIGELTPVEEEAGQDSEYDYESAEESRTMPGTVDERTEKFIADIFSHLKYRFATLKDLYPFEFSPKGNSLQRKESLSDAQYLYIYFVLAGNQNLLSSGVTTSVTSLFEIVSLACLKRHLSPNAEVHLFGKGNIRTPGHRYNGLLKNKIALLASDLKELTLFESKDFKSGDTGDGGADLVGWFPFEDEGWGSIRVMAQCACGLDWESKQHHSSPQAWSSRIAWRVNPINMIFIPRCFRASDGTWYQNKKIQGSVCVDRIRLMALVIPEIPNLPPEVLAIAKAATEQRMLDI